MSKCISNYKGQLKPNVDAVQSVTVNVTQLDARRATRHNRATCAAARALLRIRGVFSSRVGKKIVHLELAHCWHRLQLSKADQSKVKNFDATGKFLTGPLTLYPPTVKLGPATRAKYSRVGLRKSRVGSRNKSAGRHVARMPNGSVKRVP